MKQLHKDIQDQIKRYSKCNPAVLILNTVIIGSILSAILGAIFLN